MAAVCPARRSATWGPRAAGLCDAIFQALPVIDPHAPVLIGLPDTVWFPEDALRQLPDNMLSFLLFPVQRPELFDAVVTNEWDEVQEIQVKDSNPKSNWIWGAGICRERRSRSCMISGSIEDAQRRRIHGHPVNAWLRLGNKAVAVKGGKSYVDVGTLNGYREAMQLLMHVSPAGSGGGA